MPRSATKPSVVQWPLRTRRLASGLVADTTAARADVPVTTTGDIPVPVRVYFFFGVLAGLFPAIFGLFDPATLDREFTWASLPALHARFIGSFYVFAVLYTLGLLVARRRWQVASGLVAIVIFTTAVGILNLLNWEAFDFDETTVRVWIAVYIAFPVLGLALIWLTRHDDEGTQRGEAIAPWARGWFLVQAVVYGVVGVLCLVARETVADAWPWPVTNTVVQFYGGAFLSLAYISWHRLWPPPHPSSCSASSPSWCPSSTRSSSPPTTRPRGRGSPSSAPAPLSPRRWWPWSSGTGPSPGERPPGRGASAPRRRAPRFAWVRDRAVEVQRMNWYRSFSGGRLAVCGAMASTAR
jgi:hypothetical protein